MALGSATPRALVSVIVTNHRDMPRSAWMANRCLHRVLVAFQRAIPQNNCKRRSPIGLKRRVCLPRTVETVQMTCILRLAMDKNLVVSEVRDEQVC
jgi:hypothetical protein